MNTLHILNGDATLRGFEQTGLEGAIMVWREVFSAGPLAGDTSSAAFWKARSEWICDTFNESSEGYQQRMLDQLALLNQYDEINLWFEFDLHCQANMLGVLNYLSRQADLSPPAIYLICPGHFPGKETFRGMGELNGEELEYLYDTIRVQLNPMDLALAAEAWPVYVSGDAKKLKAFLHKVEFWGNLPLLKAALQAQVGLIELNQQGLNAIEQQLLDIYNNGHKTRLDIYKTFWAGNTIYGMGDTELDIYLDHLRDKQLIS